jgi:hypothetical protein
MAEPRSAGNWRSDTWAASDGALVLSLNYSQRPNGMKLLFPIQNMLDAALLTLQVRRSHWRCNFITILCSYQPSAGSLWFVIDTSLLAVCKHWNILSLEDGLFYKITLFFLCPTSVYLTRLGVEGYYSFDHTQWVGLLWTRDRPVAETSTWQHTTLTTEKHPCPQRDSNLQSQQAIGCRPTPQTARPLGSAIK